MRCSASSGFVVLALLEPAVKGALGHSGRDGGAHVADADLHRP